MDQYVGRDRRRTAGAFVGHPIVQRSSETVSRGGDHGVSSRPNALSDDHGG